MIPRTRRLLALWLVVLAPLLCAVLVAPAPAVAAAEGAESAAPISYEKEGLAQFQAQLAAHEIRAVTINRELRSLRTTLTDGRHVLAHYKRGEGPPLRTKLKAAHVPVRLLSHEQAVAELKGRPVHHKLRYIAAAVLVAVILIIVGAFLYRRRRHLREE